MSAPQQQPGIDWGNVGAVANSSAPYTSGIAPDLSGGQTFAGGTAPLTPPASDLGGGMTPLPDRGVNPDYWSGVLSDANQPAEGSRSYDLKPMFEGGGGGGFGSGGTESQSFGGNAGSFGGNIFDYTTGSAAPNVAEGTASGDKSAAAIAEEARARLADLIGSPETEKAAEEAKATPDAAVIPLPRERPEGADVERPPADIPPQDLVPLAGRNLKYELAGVNKTFAKALQEFTRDYNASQDDYSMALRSGKGARDKGFHATGNAVDVNLIDRRNGERLTDYQTRDPNVFKAYQDNANAFHTFLEKNYPELAAQHRWGGYFSGGVDTYGAQDIMHHDLGGRVGMAGGSWAGGLSQQAADTWGLPYGGGTKTPYPQFNFDWSNAPIPDVGPMPLTYKSPGGGSVYQLDPTTGQRYSPPMGGKDKMGELSSRDFVPAAPIDGVRERSGLNEGQEIPRPPADIPDPRVSGGGFNALDAAANAPVKHSGLELARANIDTPIEQIAMERGGQKAVDQVSSMAVGKTPRELLQSYGGLFMSRAEPLFSSLGITRSDFEKAITMPQTRQDLKMRFGEGGGLLGPYPEYTGSEAALGGGFPDFRQSENVDDRRDYSGLRSALGALTNTALQAFDPRDMIERNMPIPSAGSDLSTQAGVSELDARLYGDPAIRQWYKQTDDYDRLTQDTGSDAPTGSLRDFQSPATDYSAFQQPASRADLAKTMTFGGGFSPSPEPRQGGVGPEVTLSPEHMQTMAEVESHDNPALHDKGSQYKGLYQLNDAEFRKYGGTGDIYDYEENYGAAGRKMIAEGQRAQDILGRELTPVEQYMVHQQGLAGTLAHLASPDELAWKNFQSASGRSDEGAKKAIWDNLSDDMKAQFGNDVNNITSRDFINLWNEQYASKAVAAGLPRPGSGGYFSASP